MVRVIDALAATGYLRLVVPLSHGGLWESLETTGPILVEAVTRLARGDQSVALVASMHPSMLIFWTASLVASEPGSGGDIMRTKATAVPVAGSSAYVLHGAKHFGSGSQMVSFMITTARPVDEEIPLGFCLDLRDQTWDGTTGMTIAREWDGMGMKATQSHAVMLEGVEGTPWAWPGSIAAGAPTAGSLGMAMFYGVFTAVVDAAMAEADGRLAGRPADRGP